MRDALLHRYLGPPNDFVAMKNLSNYNTTASPERVYGWWPGTCSTGYNYICEVPLSSYQCPPSPPQSPAPPPDIYACEGPGQAGRLPLCHTNSQFVCTANNAFRVFNFCNDPPQSQTEFLQLAATAIALIAMPCHAKHHKPMMVCDRFPLHCTTSPCYMNLAGSMCNRDALCQHMRAAQAAHAESVAAGA
jgi:hypothetical protein